MNVKLGLLCHLLESAIKLQLADQTIHSRNPNVDRHLGNSTESFCQKSISLGVVGFNDIVVDESADGIMESVKRRKSALRSLGAPEVEIKKVRAVVME